jgi:hypothetical protein
MLRLSTLPFTTNLPFDECDLCWAGREGYPLWPDGGGYFAYDKERKIRIYESVRKRELPDLLGGGWWSLYREESPTASFYYPTYQRSFVLHGDAFGNPPPGITLQPGVLLRTVYSFTHGISFDFRSSVFLEEKPNFRDIEKNIHCHHILSEIPTNDRTRYLSKVESYLIEGDADPSFVVTDSAARQAGWLKARGSQAL